MKHYGKSVPIYLIAAVFLNLFAIGRAHANPPVYALEHLTATAVSASEIDLSWSAIAENPATTGYKVERETPIGGGFTTINANTNSAGASYVDTNLSPSVTYRYRITAINSDGYGSPSGDPYGLPSATTLAAAAYVPPPDTPTGLTLTPTSGSQLTISWTAPSQAVTVYKIDRSVGGGFGPFVSSTTGTSYADVNLSPGGTYGYRVYAINNSGMSDATQAVYATMPLPPSGPGNVKAAGGDGQVTVSWSPSYASIGGVDSYIVTGPNNISVSLPTSSLSTTIAGLTNGTIYSFYVSAQNVAGQGPAVQANSVTPTTSTPQAAPPPVPTPPPPTPTTPPPAGGSPSPTPPSSSTGFYFTFLLQQGMRGVAVMALQNHLTKSGVYSGPITGYFGVLTKAGVIAYQKAHSISPIGIVGPLTRAYLNANL